jgi:hypothetical protein
MCSLFKKHIAIPYEFLLLSFYLIKFRLEEDADTNVTITIIEIGGITVKP